METVLYLFKIVSKRFRVGNFGQYSRKSNPWSLQYECVC